MVDIHTKIARLEAQLRDKRAQARKQERREHTRRLIILGAAIAALLDEMPEERRRAQLARLHDRVVRPADRAFLGLPPLPDPGSKKVPMAPARPAPKTAPAAAETAPMPGGRTEAADGELPFPV